jgi:hypothetical protein
MKLSVIVDNESLAFLGQGAVHSTASVTMASTTQSKNITKGKMIKGVEDFQLIISQW